MRNLICLVMTLHCTMPASAQMSEDEERFWQKNFLGWDGIAAKCVGPPLPHTDRVCDAVAKELDFLCAAGKIPFVYTARTDSFAHRIKSSAAGLKHPIDFEITVWSAAGDYVFIYGNLAAGRHYSDAVEEGALKNEPQHRPKSGTLIIWDKSVMSFGTAERASSSIADSLNGFAKDFVTLYIKYRKPIE